MVRRVTRVESAFCFVFSWKYIELYLYSCAHSPYCVLYSSVSLSSTVSILSINRSFSLFCAFAGSPAHIFPLKHYFTQTPNEWIMNDHWEMHACTYTTLQCWWWWWWRWWWCDAKRTNYVYRLCNEIEMNIINWWIIYGLAERAWCKKNKMFVSQYDRSIHMAKRNIAIVIFICGNFCLILTV